MPLQNRVDPWGRLIVTAERGTLMGNRGVLHNQRREIVRESQLRRWIACEIDYRGRSRDVMSPGKYTELFFLDEGTAMAAGHRPCFECHRADVERFRAAWQAAFRLPDPPTAGDMDDVLSPAREAVPPEGTGADLPDGVVFSEGDSAWLVWRSYSYEWSMGGYRARRSIKKVGLVTVLTPSPLVAVLAHGYVPRLHPSLESLPEPNDSRHPPNRGV